MPKVELFSVGSFLVLGQQLLIGIALGLMTQFLLESFVMAGQIIAMQTSLGFATLVDPMNGQSAPGGGPVLPDAGDPGVPGGGWAPPDDQDGGAELRDPAGLGQRAQPARHPQPGELPRVMYQASLVMALSAIIALLLINFAFGVMTRAAPQLNIFSIGFAVSMMSGLFILWLTIGGFMGHFDALWERVQETSCELIQVQCLGGPAMADTDRVNGTKQPGHAIGWLIDNVQSVGDCISSIPIGSTAPNNQAMPSAG